MKALTERSEKTIAMFSGNDAAGVTELIRVKSWTTGLRNVAGIDVPTFESFELDVAQYDLFATPTWFDDAVELVREKIELELKKVLLEETTELLEQELRIVTQRVNLFEKVMIPDTKENIRVINIYLGDQQTNSVGRSKIAKRKCAARDASIV